MFGPRFDVEKTVGEETFTVVMRASKDGDAQKLAELLGDYQVGQFVRILGSPTVKDEEEWLEKCRTDTKACRWIVAVVQDGVERVVGITDLTGDQASFYTSGILLCDKRWWGKGIASATHKFRTWFAFRELEAYGIRSSHVADNIVSGRALASVGYVVLGRERRMFYSAGKWRDMVLLACYNPAVSNILWPEGNVPGKIAAAMAKTNQVLQEVDALVKPR